MMTLIFVSALTCDSAENFRRGKVTTERVAAGLYQQYVPRKHSPKITVVVICHGTISDGTTAKKTSLKFINRWIRLSEHTGAILVAPAFDVENFAGGTSAPGGSSWGYRALDGRLYSSDEFIHQIITTFQTQDTLYDGRFYLYGHSAGAQFANHYLVVHPERLLGVALSAPAIYAMPDPNSAWPTGMKARTRSLKWGNTTKRFHIEHQPETWVKAVQLPVCVAIGLSDTERISNRPQQGGWTRVDRAKHYVKQMKEFAQRNGVNSGVFLRTARGIGHSSAGLTNLCGKELVAIMERQAQ